MGGFYHVCFAVPDIGAAMDELAAAVGVEWSPPRADRIGEWDFRIAFTRGDPPFIELIEGPEGSPWACGGAGRFDHLGFWTSDLEAGTARLSRAGVAADFDGCPFGRRFAYHRAEAIGGRIELVDAARLADFRAAWAPGAGAMPVIDPPRGPGARWG
ncbi:VOC family protein [Nocardiopsis composta]|uniref:VOC domain-containing protein n=1 Tax=Nocardiopsis composta TaxID=157465 RepID=A0A7W8QHZ1_9ACTN|nr:VOC family protein [Nocardiopsis composta]MBB5430549.1 hypothetical protein [Nocardiopsis composta]